MFLLKLLSSFPLFVLYRISDVLAFLAYRIFRYRRKTIFNNLSKSFPDKSKKEIMKIMKSFYLNLSDIMVETIKAYSISPEELQRRVKLHNLNVLEDPLKEGQSVITLTSHQGNWEWLLLSNSVAIKNGDVIAAFQPVRTLADYMKYIRSRFGAKLVEKNRMVREMIKKTKRPAVYALVADQTPTDVDNRFYSTFLNQNTPFYSGAEKMAMKYNMVVLYVHMRRVRRGYYEVKFIEIGTPPYNNNDFLITKNYIKYVEEGIIKDPSQWLWSHNRWKHNSGPTL